MLCLAVMIACRHLSPPTDNCPKDSYFWGMYNRKKYCVKCPAGKYSSGCLNCAVDPHATLCKAKRVRVTAEPHKIVPTSAPPTPHPAPKPTKATAFTDSSFSIIPCTQFTTIPNPDPTKPDLPHSCPKGQFQDQSAAGKCTKCPPGKWQETPGRCYCTSCAAGMFQPFSGYYACYACPKGKFTSAPGKDSCRTCSGCASGKYGTTSMAADHSNLGCTCLACQAGKYASADSVKCQVCAAGQFSQQQSFGCQACPRGKYQAASAQASCNDCFHKLSPDHRRWVPQTTKAIRSISQSQCYPAPTAAPTTSPTASPSQSPTPSPSPNPTRAPTAAPTTAVPTASPTTSPTTAVPTFSPTPSPTVSPTTAPSAHPTFQPTTGNPTTIPSPAPTPVPTLAPTSAPVPTWSPTLGPTLGPTAVPTSQPTTAPTPSPSVVPTPAPTSCSDETCPAGRYKVGNIFDMELNKKVCKCVRCPRGKFSTGASNACKICAAGRYGVGGSETEKCSGLCPAGRYGNHTGIGVVTCSGPCLPGRYGSAGDSTPKCKSACRAGRFGSPQGGDSSASCLGICKKGSFSTAGSTSCTQCAAGQYQGAKAQSSCHRCSAGLYNEFAGEMRTFCRSACPSGYYSQAGAALCTACPSGYFAPKGSSKRCQPCPSGTASAKHLGSEGCQSCSIGQYSSNANGAPYCTVCPKGYYGTIRGNTACSACLPGHYGNCIDGCKSRKCTGLCRKGRYSTANMGGQGNSLCTGKCPPGKFSDGKVDPSKCISCSPGMYQNSAGATKCFPCPSGRYSASYGEISHLCQGPCQAGRYGYAALGGYGKSKWQGDTAKNCSGICGLGEFSRPGDKACTACPAGKYSGRDAEMHTTFGAAKCLKCPPGHYGTKSGMTSWLCEGVCSLGYQSTKDAQGCEKNATLFKIEMDALRTPAPTAMPTSNPSPAPCNKGFYHVVHNFSKADAPSADCHECPLGKYQPSIGQKSCLKCARGMTTLERGWSSVCMVKGTEVTNAFENPADAGLAIAFKNFLSKTHKQKGSPQFKKHEFDDAICDHGSHMETGYIAVGKGTSSDPDKFSKTYAPKNLFYWFSESRHDPNAPLILWLAGGPGVSSLVNLFYENGPCYIDDQLKAVKNEHSWTEHANVIWLDQPAGVGFSYLEDVAERVHTTDQVANDITHFLQVWFDHHTDYSHCEFYIFGQSYAGHFVPAVAQTILNFNDAPPDDDYTSMNLKGIGLQNGFVNPQAQFNLFSTYLKMTKFGEAKQFLSTTAMAVMRKQAPHCISAVQKCNQRIDDTFSASNQKSWCLKAREVCDTVFYRPSANATKNNMDIRDSTCKVKPFCYNFKNVQDFCRLPSTLRTLGIRKKSNLWFPINQKVYEDFLEDWAKDYSPYVGKLLDRGMRVLVYAGDADYDYNWVGNKAWAKKLKWKHQKEFESAKDVEWRDMDTLINIGEVRTAKGLTFIRLYGAGLMTTLDKPREMGLVLKTWLSRHPKYTKSSIPLAVGREDEKDSTGRDKYNIPWCGSNC